MLADPERALRVLDHVQRSSSVRNPAALANALWRQSALQLTQTAAPLPPEPRDDYEEGLPTSSVIEYAWSSDPRPMADSLLDAMAAALGRGGGFTAIRETFARSDYWELDDDGNLLTTNPDWIRTGPDGHDRLLERKPNHRDAGATIGASVSRASVAPASSTAWGRTWHRTSMRDPSATAAKRRGVGPGRQPLAAVRPRASSFSDKRPSRRPSL